MTKCVTPSKPQNPRPENMWTTQPSICDLGPHSHNKWGEKELNNKGERLSLINHQSYEFSAIKMSYFQGGPGGWWKRKVLFFQSKYFLCHYSEAICSYQCTWFFILSSNPLFQCFSTFFQPWAPCYLPMHPTPYHSVPSFMPWTSFYSIFTSAPLGILFIYKACYQIHAEKSDLRN